MQVDDEALRRAYIVTLVVPLAFIVAMWAAIGTPTVFIRLILPFVAVALGSLLIGVVTRTLPLRVIGPVMFVVPTAVLFVRVMLWRIDVLPESGEMTDQFVEAVWFIVVFPLAFLVFGTRRGLQVSIAAYAGFVLASSDLLVAALTSGTFDAAFLQALSLPAVFAVLIGLLWVLASRLERMVAERERAEAFARQAFTDPLTGAANRRRLEGRLDELFDAARAGGPLFSVVLADLDHFKHINDTAGHDAGDRALAAVVERLRAGVRDSDLVGRWGGEEFVLIAADTTYEDALEVAERCRREIRATPIAALHVTASFGVSAYHDSDDMRSLMRRADLALYTAKNEGRDRVVGLPALVDPSDVDAVDRIRP
ncbi:MAG: GGDEF domain-containing protein [Nitriliruptoraceae bacterium]